MSTPTPRLRQRVISVQLRGSSLLQAARANHVEVMRALVEGGGETKMKVQDGTTWLFAASGRVAAAKYAFQLDKDLKGRRSNRAHRNAGCSE